MLVENKKQYIMDLLKNKSFVTVSELSQKFQQSEVTIRKLLISMEKDGLLKRTWGGAVNLSTSLIEYSHEEKETKNIQEKKAIAMEAYNYINNGDSIFLDSGTTTIQLAKLISQGEKHHIMVCTNALNIALEFCNNPNIDVFVIGGEFRHKIKCCTGVLSIEILKRFHFDKSFVTGNHFTLDMGFTTPTVSEAEVKRAILLSAKRKFVLMDSSKYGDNSLCTIASIAECDCMITDWHAPENLVEAFREQGTTLIRAEELQGGGGTL